MKALTYLLARTANAAHLRFRRARPGSVLILIVALLVLIAIVGTALISTARIDRVASREHTANSQADQLAEDVVSLARDALVQDLFEAKGGGPPPPAPAVPRYRPARPTAMNGPYDRYQHADSPYEDAYLASRVPTITRPNVVGWPVISGPLIPGGRFINPKDDKFQMEPNRFWTEPTFVTDANGKTYPALRARLQNNNLTEPFLAADTDGDGVADAALYPFPFGAVDGVTYYYAVRIIDNAGAVNLSTAYKPSNYFPNPPDPADTYLPGNFFTTNINLESLLYGETNAQTRQKQSARLNAYRAADPNYPPNNYDADAPVAWQTPVPPAGPPVDDHPTNPTTPVRHDEFEWISFYDILYHQLARRLDYPGFFDLASARRFRAVSAFDGKSLAYKGGLVLNAQEQPKTDIERLLRETIRYNGPNTGNPPTTTVEMRSYPYQPQDAELTSGGRWFYDNFDYDDYRSSRNDSFVQNNNYTPLNSPPWNDKAVFSRRALFVTRSPVSAQAPVRSLQQSDIQLSVLQGGPDLMSPVSINQTVRKVNINTANFGELWRAFYQVMRGEHLAAETGEPPFDTKDGVFRSPLRVPLLNPVTTTVPGIPPGNTNPHQMTPEQVRALRAAIAAVNVEDMRDSDNDVTSRKFSMPIGDFGQCEVTVFGTETPIFITEVYANNYNGLPTGVSSGPDANPKGYVAIEFFNPNRVPVSLNGWRLGVMRRSVTPATPPTNPPTQLYPEMFVRPLSDRADFDAGTIIPPGGFLVIDNFEPPPPPAGPPLGDPQRDAKYRPASSGMAAGPAALYRYVRGLHNVMFDKNPSENSENRKGGELVLMRPRRADGYTVSTTAPGNEYKEFIGNTVRLFELVPVDSFDFGEMSIPLPPDPNAPPPLPGQEPTYEIIHYQREAEVSAAADGGGKQWRAVYPGRWRPTEVNGQGRQEGTLKFVFAPLDPNRPEPATVVPPASFGTANGAPSYSNPFMPVQLENFDSAGPNQLIKPGSDTVDPNRQKQRYPFGGFARNGDILRTPFIGAYRIRRPQAVAQDNNNPLNPQGQRVIEFNPITLDSSFADDLRPETDVIEQLGRFCPLLATGVVTHTGANTHANKDSLEQPSNSEQLAGGLQSLTDFERSEKIYDPNPQGAYGGTVLLQPFQNFQFRVTDCNVDLNALGIVFPQVTVQSYTASSHQISTLNEFVTPPQTPPDQLYPLSYEMWHPAYDWALDLFDYFEVSTPGGDAMPNVPTRREGGIANGGTSRYGYYEPYSPGARANWTEFGSTPSSSLPTPVPSAPLSTGSFQADQGRDDLVPQQGLININTAPWPVLATIPFVNPSERNAAYVNREIAKAIVRFREGDPSKRPGGSRTPDNPVPFRTIFDLDRVALFHNRFDTMITATHASADGTQLRFNDTRNPDNDIAGDLSPFDRGRNPTPNNTDRVAGDFESRYSMLTRISNLITTRSDGYTCYIQVQGWRNAGTANAELATQRRVAFFADRSAVTPTNKTFRIDLIPTD